MTLEEAINHLKKDLLVPGSVPKLEFQDAEQLGIEALKFRQDWEAQVKEWGFIPLPGETKE